MNFLRGSPADRQLNFAIALLSIAFSSISALATADFASPRVENVFTFVAVVGVLMGVYLLISWYPSRVSHREVCQRIRRRIPSDALPRKRNEDPSVGDEDPSGEDIAPK